MRQSEHIILNVRNVIARSLLLIVLITLVGGPVFAQKAETIEAQAIGTGTQLGQNIGITLIIQDYSTMAERQTLVDAFQKGQNQGLANALRKMRAVGRISITGTLGYDVSYIRLITTPTGRRIRFITNRQISFGEAFFDTQSQSFNLT